MTAKFWRRWRDGPTMPRLPGASASYRCFCGRELYVEWGETAECVCGTTVKLG